MPPSQWWRSSAPACPGKGPGFVCHCWYFQLAIHTSACPAIYSAAPIFHGQRNLNLLLKPVWQWFSFFLITRTQNTIKISSCHPTSCIWKYRAVSLKATHYAEKTSIIFSLLLHKWISLKYLRIFSFLKKRKGHGQADEEHVTPL